MPALSKKQQKFMGIVRSIQKGEQPASKFSKDAQDVAKDMKKSSVKKFAGTKHKGLPMKKEVLKKLKEMIRQELSEYTYGSGDIVKDVNPTCPHYGAMGKVKSVGPRSVVFVVMNKGKNFKPGMELEKSHDQMKKMNENKVYKVGDTVSLLSFDRRNRGRAKVKGVTKSRANKFGIKNHYITNKGTFTDMEVEGTEAFKLRFKGDTEKKVTKAMNSPYGVVLPEQSVNEMSAKSKKIINKLGKKEKEMFMDMIDIMGFDQVMADYKKDKKAFKQALKDMSEGVIQEKISVKSSKEYFDNLDTAINLIVRQANNLKGQLGKHPIKQNVNKLRAVKTMLKRGISPAFYAYEKDTSYTKSFKATDLNYIKKSLQDGKFRRAVSELMRAIDTRSYDSNDFYFLKNDYKKEDKLRERLVGVLKDLVNKMENAQLENINEDGHTDVASSKRKVMLMVDDSNKLLNKLNGMNLEDSLPSWWTDKITLSQNYLAKATDYIINPVESVNENLRQSDKKVLMVIGRDFVQWINSKFKHGLGKKEIRGLKQTLPNMLSILGRPEDKRYNKFKSSMKHSPIRKHNDKLLARLSKGFDKMSDYDKKVFVNTLMLNAGLLKVESVNEAKEPDVITQLRDIVKRKTNKKIKDPKTKKTMRVDMFTASAITQVYDAVKKTSHKSKFESLPLDKMAQLSFKMMK